MKGLLRPVGPESARVYWVRRLVVLAVAVVLLVVAGLLISKAFGSSEDPDDKPTAEPTKSAEETPSPDSPCQPEDLSLTLNDGPDSVAEGKDAAFDVAVTNEGEAACTIDLGDESRVLTITSGSDRIWSSRDCPADDEDSRLVLLRPGSANVNTVVWEGERSNPDCDSDLPKPRAGTYNLEIEMEDLEPVTHRFEITSD